MDLENCARGGKKGELGKDPRTRQRNKSPGWKKKRQKRGVLNSKKNEGAGDGTPWSKNHARERKFLNAKNSPQKSVGACVQRKKSANIRDMVGKGPWPVKKGKKYIQVNLKGW